ncbi:phage tail tape measure protein [Crossiella sp. CA198]|uniref:phage tail tape measure protein n=1 Tax=Crossiella sp. CA198 TaxID=3455607 RepID=UPI003F8D5A5C
MAKPIQVSILGDVQDLMRSLGTAEGGIAAFVGKLGGAASSATASALKFAAAGLTAGGIGASITESLDRAKISAKLGAQLGATAEESKRYGDLAGSMYAKGYGANFGAVATAIKTVTQDMTGLGVTGSAELEKITGKALTVAETFDQDLGGVTRAVSQLLRTGLVKDSNEAFDVITRGMQLGADKSGDLLDTLNEYPTQFRDLGLSGQQAMGLLTQGLQAGARDSDIVADALKEFAIRAKDGSKTTTEGFAAIGLSADKMAQTFAKGGPAAAQALDTVLDRLRAIPDPAKRSAIAVNLFGTQSEDLQQALYALDPSAAVGALGEVAGAADRAGEALHGSAQSRLDTFVRGLQGAFVNAMGSYVIPAVERLTQLMTTYLGPALTVAGAVLTGTVIPALSGLAKWLGDNHEWLSIVAGVVGALFVPALVSMGVAATVARTKLIATWVAARYEAIATATKTAWVTTTIISRFVAMGAVAVWEGAKVVGAWGLVAAGAVRDAATTAGSWALGAAKTVGSWAMLAARATWEGAKTAGAWALTAARVIGSGALMAGQAVAHGAVVAGSWALTAARAIGSAAVMVGSMALTAASVVAGWVAMGAAALVHGARMAAGWVLAMGPVGWITAAVIALVALIIANWDTVVEWTTNAWNAVSDAITSVVDAIVSIVDSAIQSVLDAVDGLKELHVKALLWFGRLYEGAVAKLNELWAWVKMLPERLVTGIGDLGQLLWDKGTEFLSGLWAGIQDRARWLRDKIFGFFRNLLPDWVRDALGIASPSRVMMEIGRWLPVGMAAGIDRTARVALAAAGSLAAGVADAMTPASMPTVAPAQFGRGMVPGGPGVLAAPAWVPRMAPGATVPTRTDITVHVATNADPHEIGREIAWSLRTQGR